MADSTLAASNVFGKKKKKKERDYRYVEKTYCLLNNYI